MPTCLLSWIGISDMRDPSTPDGSFVFAFAHDLRSHLRTSLTRVQLVKLELAKEDSTDAGDQKLQWLLEAESATKTGARLLDAVVAFCDVRPSAETITLSLLVRGVLLELKKPLEDALVSVSAMPVVRVPFALQAVLREVICNSMKFHDSSRPLEIRIESDVSPNGGIRIVVTDNGLGIDPDMTEKIFLPFGRVHDRTRYPGFGLGLAHCRKVVEMHGGRIVVAASDPVGLCVEISFPDDSRFGA